MLATPDAGMLEGVSRGTVIEMGAALGLPLQARPVSDDELRGADEVFLSTSGGGVLPVRQVDDRTIGNGAPGAITARLVETYWAWHADPAYSLPIDYSV